MLSQLFAITPGGVGQTQALDVVTLRGYGSADSIAAFSITQDAVITIWNVVLGVAVMLWAFGYRQVKELLSKKDKKQPQEQAPESAVRQSRPGAAAASRTVEPAEHDGAGDGSRRVQAVALTPPAAACPR